MQDEQPWLVKSSTTAFGSAATETEAGRTVIKATRRLKKRAMDFSYDPPSPRATHNGLTHGHVMSGGRAHGSLGRRNSQREKSSFDERGLCASGILDRTFLFETFDFRTLMFDIVAVGDRAGPT